MASCLAAAPRVSIPLFGADLSRGDSPKAGTHASTLAAPAQAVRALCRQHALGALCARAPVTLRSKCPTEVKVCPTDLVPELCPACTGADGRHGRSKCCASKVQRANGAYLLTRCAPPSVGAGTC